MSLYLKYRPVAIDELDLTHVRESLLDVAKSGKVSHAYLFDGPRGAGKTSSARILARMVTCEKIDDVGNPCGKCGACQEIADGSSPDLIEIDAASNRGIDDIRDLKERINLAPNRLRRKVYIIDEVHMLTAEAFNALLKTLEEPPSHALFVLCTTESHKLPETIISRCTRITFRKANDKEMLRSLSRVADSEDVKVEDGALEFLASSVDGSFRDGVKVLDQVISKGEKITKERVEEVLYGASGYSSKEFVEALVSKDVNKALSLTREANNLGLDMKHLLTSSMYMIRDALLSMYGEAESPIDAPVSLEHVSLVRLLDQTSSSLSSSSSSDLLVEMAVLEWCSDRSVESELPPRKSGGGEKEKEGSKPSKGSNGSNGKNGKSSNGNGKTMAKVKDLDLKKGWVEVMSLVSDHYSLETLLSSARLKGVEDGELVVEVSHAFHKQQLETERFRRQVEELAFKAFSSRLKLRFEVGEYDSVDFSSDLRGDQEDAMMSQEDEEDDLVEAAQEIFKEEKKA